MRRKLIYLISFVLVLGLVQASVAEGADPNLVGWWKLDDSCGTTAIDSSNYGNNGTLLGDPKWVPGRIGGALNLDGTNDYVDCGSAAVFNINGAITLSAWVKTNDAGNGQHNSYVTKGDHSYAIKHFSGNSIEFFIYDGDWIATTFSVDSSFNGVWHHLAGTYDGTQVKLYIDGELRNTKDHVGPIASNAYNVNIGADSEKADRFYNGVIDDVRIYNRALSGAEITSIMGGSVGSISHYHPELSPAELYEAEAQGSGAVNFRGFALLANMWLEGPMLRLAP
ncbi:MAG: LamG domain-containing protein [Sedimentisphaerales bacterium]|nr:LamG domain-containing protein [Sedimentisphaerales bacterium]